VKERGAIMAYLRMNCPNCRHEAEYVYVQVGQPHCCKKCNHEFVLKPRSVNYFAYATIPLAVTVIGAALIFILWRLFNWYVYKK
jgi:hypothetical protein